MLFFMQLPEQQSINSTVQCCRIFLDRTAVGLTLVDDLTRTMVPAPW